MVMCFAPDCKHYSEKNGCKFFTFLLKEAEKKVWIKNIRKALKSFKFPILYRQDREPSSSSRICHYHFKDGIKENGPTIFQRNEDIILISSPEKKKRRKSLDLPRTSDVTVPSASQFLHTNSSATIMEELEFLQNENKNLKIEIENLRKSNSMLEIENDLLIKKMNS
nr:uncharacterized protein LOC122272209 [Parasteatoda tepidariorum]